MDVPPYSNPDQLPIQLLTPPPNPSPNCKYPTWPIKTQNKIEAADCRKYDLFLHIKLVNPGSDQLVLQELHLCAHLIIYQSVLWNCQEGTS